MSNLGPGASGTQTFLISLTQHPCPRTAGPPLNASKVLFRPTLKRLYLKKSGPATAVCSLFLLLTAVSAQSPSSDVTLTANPVFQKNCAKCHGKTAEGRRFGGPSLASDKIGTESMGNLHDIITNGKGHMPKYAGKLTSEEIDAMVQQIKSLNKK